MPCPLEDILFKDCVAINPGIMRPKWYGNCVATYGHLTFFAAKFQWRSSNSYFHLNRWNHHELPNGHSHRSHNLGFEKGDDMQALDCINAWLQHDYNIRNLHRPIIWSFLIYGLLYTESLQVPTFSYTFMSLKSIQKCFNIVTQKFIVLDKMANFVMPSIKLLR